MANRGMSAAMLAEIAKDSQRLVHLLKIGLSTPAYITTAYKDISYNGDTYLRLGHLLKIGAVTESARLVVQSFEFTLSGVDKSFIASFLSENVTNKTINYYMGFLDSNGDLIANPVNLFTGRIDNFEGAENTTGGTAEINVFCSDHWADWEKVAGRRTNDQDQQIYFPGDKGFEFSALIINDLKWGKSE